MEVREPSAKYLASPHLRQSEAGRIPNDWLARPLLTVVRIASGQVDPKQEPYRSMVLVAPDHIEAGTGRLLKKETSSDQDAISGKYLFEAGDVVYSKIRPYLRKAVLTDFSGLCSADMYPLRAAADIAPGFIVAVVLGPHFSKYAESVSVRSGMPKVNRSELAQYWIAIPPTREEQSAIAEVLRDADALIDSLEQLLTKKRQIKQGAMQELLTGKRRLPGFRGAWAVVRLGAVANITMGRTPSRLRRDYWGSGFKWLSIADLKGKVVEESKEQVTAVAVAEMVAVPKGTLLMSFKLTIGRLCFAGCDLFTNEAICALRDLRVDAEFLYYALSRVDFSLFGKQAVKGSTLNSASLKAVAVDVPDDRGEQHAIAQVLSDIDADLSAIEARLAKARDLKQAMMQVLLTGRIRLVQPAAA
jgi:type I restriction enzyme, S subunit